MIPYPIFLLNLPIIGLGGFSLATWPFETHQLPYRAKIFSLVPQFSSLVSFIGLESFSPSFNSSSTIPRSAELAFKERSNCNNVTLRAESFQSRSHMTIIIQNFILVSLIFSVTSHLVEFLLGAAIFILRTQLFTHPTLYALDSLRTWLLIHSTPYALDSLRTWLFTHSTPYALDSLRIWLLMHLTSYALNSLLSTSVYQPEKYFA